VRFLTLCNGDVRRMECALIFQMTYIGMPAVYYGDEVGMIGSGEWTDSRRGMIWREDEQNRELLDFHRRLIRIRKSHEALTHGDFTTLHADSATNTYAYLRSRGEGLVVVAINNSCETQCLTVRSWRIRRGSRLVFTDLLTGEKYRADEGRIRLSLAAYKGVIFSGNP
jgi:cyclomaltodextrinase